MPEPTNPPLSPVLTPREIEALLAKRELARRNFKDFLAYWLIADRQPLKWTWFHDYLADVMQSIAARQRKRVIINMPPRHLKSTIATQAWHAWMIGREDNYNSAMMSLSLSSMLASRDSRLTMRMLQCDWYKVLFPHVQLVKENEAEWETAGGAYRIAVGRGGTVTGRGGAHICVAGGSQVLTANGWKNIEDVLPGECVHTPDGFRAVTASYDNGIQDVIEIQTADCTLLLTPTHLCSTPSGWREAHTLCKGDEVHALEANSQELRALRHPLHGVRTAGEGVLPELCGTDSAWPTNPNANLPSLQNGIPADSQSDSTKASALQPGVSQRSQKDVCEGRVQPIVQTRQTDDVQRAVSAQCGPHSESSGNAVRQMLDAESQHPVGSAPYQLRQARRLTGEPSGAVRPVPSRLTRNPTPRGKTRVYDLTVERAHCFYANGLLVHNCVDDLIKADEANSDTVREQANEWMGETLASRLNDPMTGTITVIMQRLHERDVTGYLKAQMKHAGADQYEHIVLPLEAPCRTIVSLDGKLYKDRPAGDLLQPERIGPTQVAAMRVAMRANFDGQYQQNPQKQTGGMLDPSNLIRLDATTPELIRRFGLVPHAYLDFATREKELNKDDPDYSTILVAAKDQLGRLFFLDLFRRQCDYEALGRALIQMQRVYSFRCIKGEKGGLINTFLPALRMLQKLTGTFFDLVPFKGPSSRGDKVARSMSFQGLLNAGMICVPTSAPWLIHLEGEMRSFPNGSHDDVIDVAAMATNDTLDIREGEAPVYKTTDERELMDQDHKAELDRRIVAARQGDDGGYNPDKDLDW